MDLSRFHGKRIAVVLQRDESSFVIRGTAAYESDGMLGNFLRIPLQADGEAAEGDPHMLLYEERGDFTIAENGHGCDFYVTLKSIAVQPPGAGRMDM